MTTERPIPPPELDRELQNELDVRTELMQRKLELNQRELELKSEKSQILERLKKLKREKRRLSDIRRAHRVHLPLHDDRGVLPMIVSETGACDEPETERIICASISGGADYINNMPRTLTLERINSEGSTYQKYIQDPIRALADHPAPQPPAEEEVGEFVAQLKRYAEEGTPLRLVPFVVARAADLLSHLAPQPVPEDQELYDYWISTSPEFGCADPVGYARSVLARWGTPNLAQVRSSLGDEPLPQSGEGEV